jgi:dipeptidyl aminopeptidase/acylaminoacyl peptidase
MAAMPPQRRLVTLQKHVCTVAVAEDATDKATAAAYARAEVFTNVAALNQIVSSGEVTPHWQGRWVHWLRRIHGGVAKQFVALDTSACTGAKPAPLFDHGRLASALLAARLVDALPAPAAGAEVELPFSAVTLELATLTDIDSNTRGGDPAAITFVLGGQRCRCDLHNYECTVLPPPPPQPEGVASPNKAFVAFVREYNLWLRTVDTGAEVPLSHDGREAYAYCTPLASPVEMVKQLTDHPVQRPMLQWSPDSSKIATFALDIPNETQLLGMAQNAPPDRYRPRHYIYPYPLPVDERVPVNVVKLFDIAHGRAEVSVPDAAPINQLHGYGAGPHFQWAEDSSCFRYTQTDRGYTATRLMEVDSATGDVRVVVEETDELTVNTWSSGSSFINDGSGDVLWLSERDGHTHIYLYGTDGTLRAQLTSGEWQVRGVERVDPKSRTLFFSASGREPNRDPYLQHLYRVSFGGEPPVLLTPEPAEHNITFSPDGSVFVDAYGRADLPAQTVLRSAVDGAILSVMETAELSALETLGWTAPTPFEGVADDDVTPLFGLIWWPTNYDPSQTYPLVENIYTGPHASHVPKSFKQALFHHSQAIAELGFICVFIDGRGTGDRSREFRLRSQNNLKDGAGGLDHICLMKQMGVKYPSMDLSRVGVWGHSAGGYDSARAIFDNADWYKVAISSAGCHDNRMDKASWNEQWMGKIGPHYEENSNCEATIPIPSICLSLLLSWIFALRL